LLDLDKPVEFNLNGKPQTITPNRSAADILESLATRPDPTMAASCRVEIAAE
jgi:sulfur carrier protein ThiS